jgi:hypothetical protein
MALDYDGANSKAQNDTATGFTAAAWTFLAWLNIDGAGENTTGRIFTTDETSTGGITIRTNSTTNIRFSQARATTVGIWDYAYTTGQWFALMISYDTASTSNTPVFGKMVLGTDKSLQAITATLNSTPVGAITSTASGYCIGNRADQITSFDGRIHRPRFYNRILTLEEATEELWHPGIVTNGLVIHIDDKGIDRSGNGWNATLTSTTLADPPPDIPHEFGFDDYEPYIVGGGAPASTSFIYARRNIAPLLYF